MPGQAGPREAKRRLAVLDAELAEHLSTAELGALVDVTTELLEVATAADESRQRPVSVVTGKPRARAVRVQAARRANLLRGFARRREVLDGSLTSSQVATLLRTATRQTPHDRVASGKLLAVKDGGRLRYPAWQFDPEGPDGVIAGLPEVLTALQPLSPLGRVAWFVAPRRGLGGRTPIEALRAGALPLVLGEALATHAG